MRFLEHNKCLEPEGLNFPAVFHELEDVDDTGLKEVRVYRHSQPKPSSCSRLLKPTGPATKTNSFNFWIATSLGELKIQRLCIEEIRPPTFDRCRPDQARLLSRVWCGVCARAERLRQEMVRKARKTWRDLAVSINWRSFLQVSF